MNSACAYRLFSDKTDCTLYIAFVEIICDRPLRKVANLHAKNQSA